MQQLAFVRPVVFSEKQIVRALTKGSVMALNWKKCCLFSPSLICFDLCNLERDVHLLDASGIELLHVDILDGHFSPSLPLGLETVRQLRQKTKLQFDVHLMATANENFVDELLDIGVQQLIFHVETEPHVDNLLNKIKSRNVRAGVALKPGTPVSVLDCISRNAIAESVGKLIALRECVVKSA